MSASIYKYLSHVQHIADRFLVGYPDTRHVAPAGHEGRLALHRPEACRRPERRAGERVRLHGVSDDRRSAALRRRQARRGRGADRREHGDYPRNEKGQILYPRYEFFKQCVDVFEKDGRAVPVYNDKHLSCSFEKAKWMVDASKRLRFPMLAGSSLPVTWRLPDLELPLGCQIEDALMVGEGGSDPMDYHALEAMQCMIERRKGGETGRAIRSDDRGRCRMEGGRGGTVVEGTAYARHFPAATRRRD